MQGYKFENKEQFQDNKQNRNGVDYVYGRVGQVNRKDESGELYS
jgi:hypothetical protein